MAKERSLIARRTGVPVGYEIEERERDDSRFEMWIVVVVVIIAFAMILQMDSDGQRSKQLAQTVRLVN